MFKKPLHIVSFDNPYPPVYGGAIDVFFKIKALHEIGYEICLHCFVKDRNAVAPELSAITRDVYFYKSKSHPLLFFSKLPFSVISRRNRELLKNLEKVDAPILFESEKTTYLVSSGKLANRIKVLRRHNTEQDYFAGLAASERSRFRRWLYKAESKKFGNYDAIASKFNKVATLSVHENAEVSRRYGNSGYIPVFHGNSHVKQLTGKGSYVLYHGDLETADNLRAAKFLASVFAGMPKFRFIIASGRKQENIGNWANIIHIKIESQAHLRQLIADAHINICWSFQRSGTKLKVVNALFNGRFSIINENIVDDPKVAALCHIAKDLNSLKEKIAELMKVDYTEAAHRKTILEDHLNDVKNGRLLAEFFESI